MQVTHDLPCCVASSFSARCLTMWFNVDIIKTPTSYCFGLGSNRVWAVAAFGIMQQYAALFESNTDARRSCFCTTRPHANFQVCFTMSWLPESLTVFLLLYAIRLVGWLKHCNLFLSQQYLAHPCVRTNHPVPVPPFGLTYLNLSAYSPEPLCLEPSHFFSPLLSPCQLLPPSWDKP